MSYRTSSIAVRGGDLAIGQWGPDDQSAPTVLAIHGITSSHVAWLALSRALPDHRIVAMDLRGRGKSGMLPGPWGMQQHVEDVAAVRGACGLERPLVVGHSMGGFVAVCFVAQHPSRTRALLMVDGGLPLSIPAGKDVESVLKATIGFATARLSKTFPTRDAYRDFWRGHPAFKSHWSTDVEAYSDYDLKETPAGLQPTPSADAVAQDGRELFGSAIVADALTRLPARSTLLTSPRGLVDETPGLYPPAAIASWKVKLPELRVLEIPDTNHYTILMADAGAQAVAQEIRRLEG